MIDGTPRIARVSTNGPAALFLGDDQNAATLVELNDGEQWAIEVAPNRWALLSAGGTTERDAFPPPALTRYAGGVLIAVPSAVLLAHNGVDIQRAPADSVANPKMIAAATLQATTTDHPGTGTFSYRIGRLGTWGPWADIATTADAEPEATETFAPALDGARDLAWGQGLPDASQLPGTESSDVFDPALDGARDLAWSM